METFDLDISRKTVGYNIGAKKYILVEASGGAIADYRNAIMESTTIVDGKPAKLHGLADTDPMLLSRCLYFAGPDGELQVDQEGNPVPNFLVPERVIRNWPDNIMTTLVKKLKEITPFFDEATEQSLEEEIKTKQKQLEELRGSRGENSVAKNLLGD